MSLTLHIHFVLPRAQACRDQGYPKKAQRTHGKRLWAAPEQNAATSCHTLPIRSPRVSHRRRTTVRPQPATLGDWVEMLPAVVFAAWRCSAMQPPLRPSAAARGKGLHSKIWRALSSESFCRPLRSQLTPSSQMALGIQAMYSTAWRPRRTYLSI